MSNCNCHKETIKDGAGRLTRYLRALDPSYAPIDDRSLDELLVFIQKCATRIRFYDIPESKVEDGIPPEKVSWEDFFRKDMAVIAASVATTDTFDIQTKYNEIRTSLESSPDAVKLAELFSTSISVAIKIDGWRSLSIPANPLYRDLDLAINSVLSDELRRIIAYEEGYKLMNPSKPMKLEYGELDNNPSWGTDKPIAADVSIFEGNSLEEKILNAALYADEIFNSFFNTLKNLTDNSDSYMHFAISEYPNHQPQMALFIAFLQLFQLAGKELNGITERMLNFYYSDVLQLKAKGPIPDKVHIVFELAKNMAEYNLPQNTPLKAGKDDSGVEQVYQTEEGIVINRANIKELKTIFIDKETNQNIPVIQSIYANPVANSADGNGKPFTTEENTRWETFGRIPEPDLNTDKICTLIGQINKDEAVRNYAMPGFAIASPQLVLGGGSRLVLLASDGIGGLIKQFDLQKNENPLTIWLTGQNGWISVAKKISDEELKDLAVESLGGLSTKLSEPVYSYKYFDKLNTGMLYVLLPITTDAVVAFDQNIHTGFHYNTTQPVMQVMLNPEFQIPESIYNDLIISSFSIIVQVGTINQGESKNAQLDGLKSLILQNDDQKVPGGKAFNPFTFLPGTGKSFYIGSEEVFNKPLTQLSVNIRSTLENLNRSVNLFLLKNKQWVPLFVNNDKNNFSYYDLTKNVLEYYLEVNKTATLDRHPIEDVSELNPLTRKGFIRLDNQTTFTTGEFPEILTPQELAARFEMKEVSLNYTAHLAKLEDGIDQFFHVYPFGVAEIKLNLKDPVLLKKDNSNMASETKATSGISIEREVPAYKIIRMFPGFQRLPDMDHIDTGNRLLPQFTFTSIYKPPSDGARISADQPQEINPAAFSRLLDSIPASFRKGTQNNQYSGNIQEEGLLFIGLSDIKPLQTVSILFQFAEGSAGDEDNDPPPIHWSYLSQNQWRPLPGENLITDGTYGFQTTGIIKLSLPKDATDDNTIITPGLYWLQASVTKNADRIPMLINAVTQAVEAVFLDNNNSNNHFGEALPAGSISKLKEPASQVSKVIQPFASFDGKKKEAGREFYTRVSERLRHKQRAITSWDYEHLILERFPSIFKVKCITHTDPNCLCRKKTLFTDTNLCCGPQLAPGHVLLIPVSDLKNRNGVDPLQPKTARRVLIDMVNYIKPLASPFVKVYAKNPVYEQVIVFFRVKFYTGTDLGYYLKILNDEIVRHLTPWAFEADAEVVFGQKIYASSIINFIEERPYVDFITDFKMGVCRKPCCPPKEKKGNDNGKSAQEVIGSFSNCNDVETFLNANMENAGEIVASPSSPRSILVSAPKHIIIPYEAPPIISPCQQRKMNQKPNDKIIVKDSIPPEFIDKPKDIKARDSAESTKSTVIVSKDTKTASKDSAQKKGTKSTPKKNAPSKSTVSNKKKSDKPK